MCVYVCIHSHPHNAHTRTHKGKYMFMAIGTLVAGRVWRHVCLCRFASGSPYPHINTHLKYGQLPLSWGTLVGTDWRSFHFEVQSKRWVTGSDLLSFFLCTQEGRGCTRSDYDFCSSLHDMFQTTDHFCGGCLGIGVGSHKDLAFLLPTSASWGSVGFRQDTTFPFLTSNDVLHVIYVCIFLPPMRLPPIRRFIFLIFISLSPIPLFTVHYILPPLLPLFTSFLTLLYFCCLCLDGYLYLDKNKM